MPYSYFDETWYKDWTGIAVNGEEIVSTPGHKYYLAERKKWVSAKELVVEDTVLLSDGNKTEVESVRIIHYDEAQTTYNFEVEDYHTYYVGSSVLVHNLDCTLNKPSESYDIKVSKNGKIQNYVGKGTEQRMRRSMSRLRKQGYEILSDGAWRSSLNSKTAFVDEYMRMAQYDFDFGGIKMEGKLIRYCKYGKINKYLKSKDESQYNVLDKIFKCHVDGHLKKLLSNYQFSKIEYYPHISKRGNLLQIDFWYHNLHANIEFDVNNFDYIIYVPGISVEDFDKGIITKEYDHDFDIEKFFENFYNILQKDNRLKK